MGEREGASVRRAGTALNRLRSNLLLTGPLGSSRSPRRRRPAPRAAEPRWPPRHPHRARVTVAGEAVEGGDVERREVVARKLAVGGERGRGKPGPEQPAAHVQRRRVGLAVDGKVIYAPPCALKYTGLSENDFTTHG
jgi:hypothetical protein